VRSVRAALTAILSAVLAIAFVGGGGIRAQEAPARKPMSLIDLAELPRIAGASPQLSPDGKTLAYLLTRTDWKAGRLIFQLWRQEIGGAPTQLTFSDGGVQPGALRWSPDGKTLLFLRDGQLVLFPLANKIIFNTRAVRHASSAVEFLRRMRKDGRQVADLAWTRLTGWREAVAHLMDACPGGWSAAAGGEVRLEYGGGRPGTRTLYFARWIERALPGVNVALIPVAGGPGVHSVVFAGCGPETSVRLGEGSSLEVRTAERSYSAVLPSDSEECLMREELSILGRDPVFDRVLG